MGAAGGLEAVATVLALEQGRVPPTANLTDLDPDLPPLDFVRGQSRDAALGVALSNSFAFGGNNLSLILGDAP
jgi:3-oxoacyl-[acyl-carrier-protein] synthase II